MRTSNLGFLAQVDAGKTTLTERLLHAADVIEIHQRLPALTRGEGVLECAFDGYRNGPVGGEFPTRPRTDHNPVDREEYLLRLTWRARREG